MKYINIIILTTIFLINWNISYGDNSNFSYQVPSSLSSQGSKSYAGGGINYSVNSENINLFNVETPKMSVGCSGINLDFGGFSHLDINKLGKFIQNVTMQAPTFAFEMGMQALCPSCVDLANTLQKSAQMFNGMQLDSCQALNQSKDAISKAIYNSSNNNLLKGKSNSFNDAIAYVSENLNEFNYSMKEILGCSMMDESLCPESYVLGNSSLIEIVVGDIKKKDLLLYETLINTFDFRHESVLVSFLGAIIGDVLISKKENSPNRVVIPINSLYSNNDFSSLINRLNYGQDNSVSFEVGKNSNGNISLSNNLKSRIVVYIYNKKGNGDNKRFLTPAVNTSYFYFQPTYSYSEKILNSIRVKFYPENRNMALTEQELMFLSSFKTPVYKYLNFASADKIEVDSFIHKFMILAGPQRTYEFALVLDTALTKRINQHISYLSSANMLDKDTYNHIQKIESNLSKFKRESFKAYSQAYTQFDKLIKNTKELEKLMELRKSSLLKINAVD